jgi:DNA-binding MarR family transcriptional regulator
LFASETVRYQTGNRAFPRLNSIELVRSEVRARARRSDHFKSSLFSDPAWDILLDLFLAELGGHKLSISAAGASAEVPQTTALRWIGVLQAEGLAVREDDPHDKRRSFIKLTELGTTRLHEYFGL